MAALDITRSIDITAPVQKGWAAITEPDLIAQWFGDTAEFDATPGAHGAFGWADHGGAFHLAAIEGGTRLDLIETGFEELADPQGAQKGNVEGWLAELGELLEFAEVR